MHRIKEAHTGCAASQGGQNHSWSGTSMRPAHLTYSAHAAPLHRKIPGTMTVVSIRTHRACRCQRVARSSKFHSRSEGSSVQVRAFDLEYFMPLCVALRRKEVVLLQAGQRNSFPLRVPMLKHYGYTRQRCSQTSWTCCHRSGRWYT